MQKNHVVDKDKWLAMYQQMLRIRIFEELANELYLSGKMPGLTHMYTGQEAVAVGICHALKSTDYITSTHRGHGHCVAKGANFKEMFCELLGKQEGYCRGKGGSMHIADQKNGNLGANAIVGGSAGIATGSALTSKYLKNQNATVCFFGDGALGQGLLYEVMNMASLWSLPVIYVCENNLYGEYTSVSEMAAGNILARAQAFDIESFQVDGQDVIEVNQLAETLIKRIRQGEGPFFIECLTYRYHGHHVGDINRSYYRPKQEENDWKNNKDPIELLKNKLVSEASLTQMQLDELTKEIKQQASDAMAYALNAAYPLEHEVYSHVFA
ncbi:thiamine pyrophosphate-dependent dehydrogenase E1 component subunit alpha [Thiotrichales bacterium 19S3-7]|nr:thiamine pyrophosphate-dependent dehydrogenase E1 component subunit alpha [Thiotrichales bacterium 19S3-7]MCF6800659.1 thiamine pyrophosphate-dependent dehydrogenase E1 component subunit alpha [Thiotrichales bacterium 19S3-11]